MLDNSFVKSVSLGYLHIVGIEAMGPTVTMSAGDVQYVKTYYAL